MRKNTLFLILVVLLYSCQGEDTQKRNEEKVENFINNINSREFNDLDSFLSKSFKFLSDTLILDKKEFLSNVTNPIANSNIRIIEIKSLDSIVKTKEYISDDIIKYLELSLIERKREYHFDKDGFIKAIYNLEYIESPEYVSSQLKFMKWASEEYPDFILKMTEMANSGNNIDEERKFLLTKFKDKGQNDLVIDKSTLEEKDKSKSDKNHQHSQYKPNDQFLNSFVVTHFGMNAFPYGKYTVNQIKKGIEETIMTNGNNPKVLGWFKNDNEYILKVDYKGEVVSFVFIHLLNENGEYSKMHGIINDAYFSGVEMYQFIPNLTK